MFVAASTSADLSQLLKQRGAELGFDLIGIAPAARPDTLSHLHRWLDDGHHGEMEYMSRRKAAYDHPAGALVGVKSIIMAALNYGPPVDRGDRIGRIAAYAQGSADYHDVLRNKLQQLADWLHQAVPSCRTRIAVDTAPLLERDLAQQAGLGWFGKNTMLINKHRGSYFFLGAVLTDCELTPDPPHTASHCGTCTRCLEACPTDAFPEPHVLDATRCISYLTIELRNSPVPEDLRSGLGEWLFGCDICQEVCPWNRKASAPREPDFAPHPEFLPDARELVTLSETEFETRQGHTPLSRPGRVGMARNAALVLANSGDAAHVPLLIPLLRDDSPLVRGAAAWGLGKLTAEAGRSALQERLPDESDATVRREILSALGQFGSR